VIPWPVLVFLASCSGPPGAIPEEEGSVSLLLTDAPPDTENIASVIVTLKRVDVHVVQPTDTEDGSSRDRSIDDGWKVVLATRQEFDLMALRNDVTATLGELDLPAGKITQIRLFIDEEGKNEVVRKDGRRCALDLRAVEKRGIRINHPFKALDVPAGKVQEITVDFDLDESVHRDGDCAYRLHPVIKIKRSRLMERPREKRDLGAPDMGRPHRPHDLGAGQHRP
jgi:hypothetical protein